MYSKSAIKSSNHYEKNDFMSAELIEEVPEENPEEVQSCDDDPEEEEDDPDEEGIEEEEEIDEEEVVDGEVGEKGIEDVEEDEEEEPSDVEEEEEDVEEEKEEDLVEDPDEVDIEKEEEEDPDEEEVEVGEEGYEKGFEEEEEDPEEDPDEEGMEKEEEEDPEEDPNEEMEAYVYVCNHSCFVEAADSAFSNKKPKCNFDSAEQENDLTAEAITHKEVTKLSSQLEEITTELSSGKFNKRKQNSCFVEAPINDYVFLIKRAKCNVDSAEQENDFALATEVTKCGNEIDEKILFVGALPMDFNDAKLKELFLPFGPPCGATVLIGREGRATGCGFVHFDNPSNAERAMSSMNGHKLNGGSALNVMIADFPPSDFLLNKITRETILFVVSLPSAINDEKLKELFLPFGGLMFADFVKKKGGSKSKRACVGFANPSNAARAVLSMNRFKMDGQKILVRIESCPLLPPPLIPRDGFMKPPRSRRRIDRKRKRIYVEGLPLNVDDNKLMELFLSFGARSATVYKDTETGKGKCGHVGFESPSGAAQAVSLMNGFKLDGTKITVKIERGPPTPSLDITVLKDSTCKSKGSSIARAVPLMNDCKLDSSGSEDPLKVTDVVPKDQSVVDRKECSVRITNIPQSGSLGSKVPHKMIDDTIPKKRERKRKRKASTIAPAVSLMKYSKVDGRESSVRTTGIPRSGSSSFTALNYRNADKRNGSSAAQPVSLTNDSKVDRRVPSVRSTGIPHSDSSSLEVLHRVNDGTKLFVGNIPAAFENDDLRYLFSSFGSLIYAKVVMDGDGKSKRHGYLRFTHPIFAARAAEIMNGHNVYDKKLAVCFASLDHGESSELLQMSAGNQIVSAPLALPPTYSYPSNAYSQHYTGNIIEYPPAYPPYSCNNQPPVPDFWRQPQVPQFSNDYLCQESLSPPVPGLMKGFGLHR